MVDLKNRIPEVAMVRDPSPHRWSPWLALALAVTVPASYAVSMLLPYYVNDLDRFPLDEMPWGVDAAELWPHDTAWGGAVELATVYAVLAGPLVGETGLVVAEIDTDELVRARYDFDVVGHYARPDVFSLSVDERTRQTVRFTSD